MCFFAPKPASVSPAVKPPPPVDPYANQAAAEAAERERKRLALMGGANSTIMTSALGLGNTQAPIARPTLLGQVGS